MLQIKWNKFIFSTSQFVKSPVMSLPTRFPLWFCWADSPAPVLSRGPQRGSVRQVRVLRGRLGALSPSWFFLVPHPGGALARNDLKLLQALCIGWCVFWFLLPAYNHSLAVYLTLVQRHTIANIKISKATGCWHVKWSEIKYFLICELQWGFNPYC